MGTLAPGIDGTRVVVTQRRARADHAAADVGGEALAGAAQVRRIDARQVVSPETELRDGRQADQQDAPLRPCQTPAVGARRKTSGSRISPGIWNTCSSRRRLMMTAARKASRMRPARPPISWNDCTRADRLLAARGRASARTSARPGTMRGICWMAPNAARVDARHHDRRDDRRARGTAAGTARAKLGRLQRAGAPSSRCQAGDSGRNGRMMISGIAGISPDISV